MTNARALHPVGWGLLLLVLTGCVGTRDSAPPSILLVTLDTTRADRVGAYGYDTAVTPTLDRLARQGVLFEAAFAPTPTTLPSHTSILTGVYPSAHGVHDNGLFVLDPDALLVSEVLQRHGWRTGAFVGSYALDARFGLAQGFEAYRGPNRGGRQHSGRFAERPANEVIDDAIAWLSSLSSGEKFFVWIHLFDPHSPYRPPQPWMSRFEDAYDAEIAFCDAELGRLLEFLEQQGWTANLLTVVTADHGEGLGEHGEGTHGIHLYQSTLHVPLVLSGPPVAKAQGTRVAGAVSIADLAPTLLALAGLSRAELPEARLPALLQADGTPAPTPDDRALYLESYGPYYTHRWHAYRGLVWRNLKFIQGRQPELYAISKDPRELSDLADTESAVLAGMQRRLETLLEEHPPLGWTGSAELDAGEVRRLESLGYAIGSSRGDPFDAQLPDPKERIGDLKLYRDAVIRFDLWMQLQRRKESAASPSGPAAESHELLESAREILMELRRNDPNNPMAASRLGLVEMALGNYAAASSLMEESIGHRRPTPDDHYSLARLHVQTGRAEDARREIRRGISLEPRQSGYYPAYVAYFIDIEKFDRASWWLRQMREAVEAESPDQQQVRRWTELAHAAMRLRGHEPAPLRDARD